MSKNKTKDIVLTEEQKEFVLANWDKIPLIELAQQTFNNPEINGHFAEARAIKQLIAEHAGADEVKAKLKTTKFVKADEVVLTEEQKLFVRNNMFHTKPLECTKVLFKDQSLTPLSLEFRAVSKYYEHVNPNIIPPEEKLAGEDYKPPTSIARLIPRVNRHVTKNRKDGKLIDPDNPTKEELRHLTTLLDQLQVFQSVYQGRQYKLFDDIELYEGNLIRFLYGKTDVEEEELNEYISLCAEIVSIAQIERTIQALDFQLQAMLDGSSEEKKLSMTFVETINGQREKLNQSKVRREKLTAALSGARSDRVANRVSQNASILNLVEAWRNEEKRKELIELAELEKKADENEVDRLSSLDAVTALIAGVTKKEGYT